MSIAARSAGVLTAAVIFAAAWAACIAGAVHGLGRLGGEAPMDFG
jgi:hypothetical protein